MAKFQSKQQMGDSPESPFKAENKWEKYQSSCEILAKLPLLDFLKPAFFPFFPCSLFCFEDILSTALSNAPAPYSSLMYWATSNLMPLNRSISLCEALFHVPYSYILLTPKHVFPTDGTGFCRQLEPPYEGIKHNIPILLIHSWKPGRSHLR